MPTLFKYSTVVTIMILTQQIFPQDNIDLSKAVTADTKAQYEQFIYQNAPSGDAFLALQRLIEPNLKQEDWDGAIEIVQSFRDSFDFDTTKVDKLINILKFESPQTKLMLQPLGKTINTSADEYNPTITFDGDMIFFTGDKRKGGIGNEDIFYSEFDQEKRKWGKTKALDRMYNTKGEESISSISWDKSLMVIRANYPEEDSKIDKRGDLFLIEKDGLDWKPPVRLPEPINSEEFEGSGCFSTDKKWLIFSSSRPGGQGSFHRKGELFHGDVWGNQDLYVCEQIGENEWGPAINLGPIINTPYAEISPFLHYDGKTLYFSSDGHPGFGRTDVFKSERISYDSWTEWTVPVNIGPLFNSPDNDFGYKVSADGNLMYFAKMTSDKGYDIFTVEIHEAARPKPVVEVKIKVTDPEGEPLPGVELSIENLETAEIVTTAETAEDGTATFIVSKDSTYVVAVTDTHYFPTVQQVFSDEQLQHKEPDNNLVLSKEDVQENIQYERIEQDIDMNVKVLDEQNALPVTQAPNTILLSWPLRAADSTEYGVHGVSAHRDHDQDYPGYLLDYFCSNRTYDLAIGYNHMGTDIFLWPFAWYKMEHDEVEVIAAAPGTIIGKDNGNYDRNCGLSAEVDWNAVYIQHPDGTRTWYGHLKNGSLTPKKVGDWVERGEYLGIVGSSGASTGPHLHFEVYDTDGDLVDPYRGNCNQTTDRSLWLNQRSYFDPAVNKLMTHSAPPSYPDCPQVENLNAQNEFQQGDSIYFGSYYRDQQAGVMSIYRIVQPDGSVFTEWQHSSDSTYIANYWGWWHQLPYDAQTGDWQFFIDFLDKTYEHIFHVEESENGEFIPKPLKPFTSQIPEVFIQLKAVHVVDDGPGGCVTLPEKVLFDRNRWTIKPVAYHLLPRIVEMMKRNNRLHIDIVGHTDTDGSDAYNNQLSIKRAKAVVNYLVQIGIDERRLTPFGSGEKQPIIENGIENKAKSRRVEFCITN